MFYSFALFYYCLLQVFCGFAHILFLFTTGVLQLCICFIPVYYRCFTALHYFIPVYYRCFAALHVLFLFTTGVLQLILFLFTYRCFTASHIFYSCLRQVFYSFAHILFLFTTGVLQLCTYFIPVYDRCFTALHIFYSCLRQGFYSFAHILFLFTISKIVHHTTSDQRYVSWKAGDEIACSCGQNIAHTCICNLPKGMSTVCAFERLFYWM